MDIALPTGRLGNLVALAVTIFVLGLVWIALVQPLIDLHAEREDRLRQQETLSVHMRQLAEELPALRTSAHTVSGTQPNGVLTIAGSSDAVAAATLQSMLQEMAGGTGANLSSIENVPAETTQGYRRIGLKISFDAKWPVLVSLLKSIGQATPPMTVDNLEIHASPMRVNNTDTGLDVSLTVYALRVATSDESHS